MDCKLDRIWSVACLLDEAESRNSKVGEGGDRTFRSAEVQHISVFPKHVDFLHARDGLDVEFLQSAL